MPATKVKGFHLGINVSKNNFQLHPTRVLHESIDEFIYLSDRTK